MFEGSFQTFDNEDELYKDQGAGHQSDSDGLDSDVEDKILSHLYYQSNEQVAANKIVEPPQQSPDQPEDIPEDSRYQQIQPKQQDTGNTLSVTVVKPFRSATMSSDDSTSDTRHDSTVDQDSKATDAAAAISGTMAGVSFNASDGEAVDSYLDSVSHSGQMTPHQPPTSTIGTTTPFVNSILESQHIQIDSLGSSTPGSEITHSISTKRSTTLDQEDEYAYLDEAEIQGRNRYFMEEKEIICRRCKKPGHMLKDCTVTICNTCNMEGHSSRDCKMSGSVCHRCNMRGHMAAECPQKSSKNVSRAKGCHRCSGNSHHSEECTTIWRQYHYASAKNLSYETVTPWCYNCASVGHFGDDCFEDRSRSASSFNDYTAFNSYNCPGKIAQVDSSASKSNQYARNNYGNTSYRNSSINDRLGNSSSGRTDYRKKRYESHTQSSSRRRAERGSGSRHDSKRPSFKPYVTSGGGRSKPSGNSDKKNSSRKKAHN
ncbi:hypothetical protein GGI07_000013 [Coemansia sp. Benny D115]|nr:hypothetical protein GGI07_000013 [Coemansia sp. Benny D115]